MRIAICDDSVYDRLVLSNIIENYAKINGFEITISEYSSGEDLLYAFVKDSWQLIFLDIYMYKLDGIQVARLLRQSDDNCNIVFVSASREHALAGFEVRALHYLTKPIQMENIIEVFQRCKKIWHWENSSIEVVFKRMKVRIPIKVINYIEVFNKVCCIYTDTEIFKIYCTLEELMQKIANENFLHCHRSYVVNMQAIASLGTTDFVLKTGVVIPIRQADRQSIKKKYIEYLLNFK